MRKKTELEHRMNKENIDICCIEETHLQKAIRILLRLPFNTHTQYLGPLIGQQHIRTQLYVRDFRFFVECI